MAETVKYTVQKGDNLSKIARKYNTTWQKLAELNNIPGPKYTIYVGQVLVISGDPVVEKPNTTDHPTITHFGLVADSDRTMYAAWSWPQHDKTEKYELQWCYSWGIGVPMYYDTTTTYQSATYNPPEHATKVSLIVRPVSKKWTTGEGKNQVEHSHFTAKWSTRVLYEYKDNPPKTPNAPSVTINDYQLTATLDGLEDLNATDIEFHVYQDNGHLFAAETVSIVTYHSSCTFTIEPGHDYKVQARSWRDGVCSGWSGYSANQQTKPSATSITTCRSNSTTSVFLAWESVGNAETYDIEYTTKMEYFDSNDIQSQSGIEGTSYILTGIESGSHYFFRVRATNSQGSSAWSSIKALILGKKPAAPTTWSSTTTAVVGEPLNLYWVHNSEDGSKQQKAELELIINGVKTTKVIINPTFDDDEAEEKTSSYAFDTSGYTDGIKLQWRVRTYGVLDEPGDWSVQRTVDIYAPATLSLNVLDLNSNILEYLTTFPFRVIAKAGPNSQKPIGYYLSIIAQESYETVDQIGNKEIINKGGVVYGKHFDISETLNVVISANDVNLDNNIRYKVVCTVTMNSGLSAEASSYFTVAWTDEEYTPNAEIGIHNDTFSAVVRPYCMDENLDLVSDMTLAVYRRQFDGSFVELASGLANTRATFVVDPHPALDYARYRVVATTKSTGAVSYTDLAGYPVGGTSVILQWDETWSNFDVTDEYAEEYRWAGSMLKLPYNIDVTPGYNMDVALIEYTGRKHPVSYYGTQIGETATWNTTIPATDKETVYALRRLAVWPGDVYVREPHGSGYWAHVSVSFNIKHLEVTIPVTLNITRVEGGL